MKVWYMVYPCLRHIGENKGQFIPLLLSSIMTRTTLYDLLSESFKSRISFSIPKFLPDFGIVLIVRGPQVVVALMFMKKMVIRLHLVITILNIYIMVSSSSSHRIGIIVIMSLYGA